MQKAGISAQFNASLACIDACTHTQPEEAIRLCEELFRDARQAKAQLPYVLAAIRYGSIMDHLGRGLGARDTLFEALQAAQSAHLFDQEAQLLEQIARGYYSTGKYREAVQYWVRSAEVADQTGGEVRTWILSKIGLGQVYYALDDNRSGLLLLGDAGRRISEVDDPYLDAKVKINLGVGLAKLGRNDEAMAVLLQAVQICLKHQFLDYAAESNFRLGQVELAVGTLDSAMAYLNAGHDQAREVNYRWGYTNILATKAEVQARRGQYQAAMTLIKEAQAVSAENKFLHMLIDQHFAAARYAQAMGDAATGLAEFIAGRDYEKQLLAESASQRRKELEDNAGLRPSASGMLVDLSNNRGIEEGPLDLAFQLLARQSCSILQVQRASIWQLDDVADTLSCACLYVNDEERYGDEPALHRKDFPAYFGWLGDPTPLVAHDAAHHAYTWELEAPYLRARGIKSILAFNLQIGGQASTVLCFEACGAQRNWTADDVMNGRQLASVLGRAIASDERKQFQQEIGTLNSQLLQTNAMLETRVVERTAALEQRNLELSALNEQLGNMQHQLLQSEKMASIGQLAAGVAHEINNPIGFISSNLSSLENALDQLLGLLCDYESIEPALPAPERERLSHSKRTHELEYLRTDLPLLIAESKEGITRVTKIVRDLREFSHSDSDEKGFYDINIGLQSTLNLVNNELKDWAVVITEFGVLPLIECSLGRLNQVFLNLLVNAGHSINRKGGEIRVSTGCTSNEIWVKIADNGCGIKQKDMNKIFDAFFTTKPIGQGTGLGLSLSYSIIQAHQGRIEVDSTEGVGTTFTIWLPIKQAAA